MNLFFFLILIACIESAWKIAQKSKYRCYSYEKLFGHIADNNLIQKSSFLLFDCQVCKKGTNSNYRLHEYTQKKKQNLIISHSLFIARHVDFICKTGHRKKKTENSNIKLDAIMNNLHFTVDWRCRLPNRVIGKFRRSNGKSSTPKSTPTVMQGDRK